MASILDKSEQASGGGLEWRESSRKLAMRANQSEIRVGLLQGLLQGVMGRIWAKESQIHFMS